jgi:RND superfamily putative drug exporter
VAHTGRVITAAALIMTISFAALMAAQVSFMRLFGFGLTVAVLTDATLVRMALVPAFMHVLGRFAWWAPKPLARLHDQFGFSESAGRAWNTGHTATPVPAVHSDSATDSGRWRVLTRRVLFGVGAR